MKAVLRWLREALGTTPGRYRLWSVGLALLAAATGIACLIAATALRSSADRIRNNNGPVLVASQRLLASMSEADAAATASFLAGGAGDREQLRLYDEALARATTELEEMAALVGDDPEVHDVIQDVSIDVTRYAGLIEAARAHNQAAIPGGDRYLVDALDLLSGDINDEVAELTDRVETSLDDEREARADALLPPIVLGGVTLVALVAAQVYLAFRSRRLLSSALVLATVLLVAAVVWLVTAAAAAFNDIDAASTDGYQSIAVTADIQTSASRSKSAEMVALITGDAGRRTVATTAAQEVAAARISDDQIALVRTGEPFDSPGLLFDAAREADSDRERAAVAEAMVWWQRYADTVEGLRGAPPELAPLIAINQANPTFNGFNFTVESVLGDNQTQFLDRLDEGRRSLRWLILGPLAVALVAAVLALLGFQSRINEYG